MQKTKKQVVWILFSSYFKAMLFAFTGGSVTLPILQQELDDKWQLLPKDKVLELFALAQAVPGAISVNAGLMIGREIAGWPGAIAAVAGTVFPAFFGMILITVSYTSISKWSWIQGAIEGIRSASIAVIFSNALMIAKSTEKHWELLLAAAAFLAVFFFNLSVLYAILLCGFAGIGIYVLQQKRGLK